MSKRIEELEKEIEKELIIIKSAELQAKIEERKLAEKEFLELIETFFREKYDYLLKPETVLNKAITQLAKSWEKN